MITSMDIVYIEIILFSIVTRDYFVKCLLTTTSTVEELSMINVK